MTAAPVSAWDQKENWFAGITQEEYTELFHTYEWVTESVIKYFESRIDESSDPVSEVPTPAFGDDFNSIIGCEACRGGMKLVQDVFRDAFLQNLVTTVAFDFCHAVRGVFDYVSCTGFVN